MAKKAKRILVISDLHCGHVVGLTPPAWQWRTDEDAAPYQRKYGQVQKGMWKWFTSALVKIMPIDILVVNGDAVDGKGVKSGGTELITTDRHKQCDMAIKVINHINAPEVLMTYGTPFHTGVNEDWEDDIAVAVRANIGNQTWIDVNGCIIDFRHYIPGSTIPQGRLTAIAKEKMWNTMWEAEHKQQPNVDVLIRSHVHYFGGGRGVGWKGYTTPALQGFGSKFGARMCSGVVHVGFLVLDINTEGYPQCYDIIADLDCQKASVIKL